MKYFGRSLICSFIFVLAFSELLGQEVSASSHENVEQVVEAYRQFHRIFLEELGMALAGTDNERVDDPLSEVLRLDYHLSHKDRSYEPILSETLLRALARFDSEVDLSEISSQELATPRSDNLPNKVILLSAGASEKIARYGLLFGSGWFAWEFFEHFILVGIPPGALCWAFPFIWAASLGMIFDPIEHINTRPEKMPIFIHIVHGMRSYWRERHLEKVHRLRLRLADANLEVSAHGGDRSERPSQVLSEPLMKSSLGDAAFEYFFSNEFNSAAQTEGGESLKSSIERAVYGETDPWLTYRIGASFFVPLEMASHTARYLYKQRQISFLKLVQLRWKLGSLGKLIARFRILLNRINRTPPSEEAGARISELSLYAQELNEALRLLFTLIESSRKSQGEALSHEKEWNEVMKSLKSKMKKLRKAKPICAAAFVRITEADLK